MGIFNTMSSSSRSFSKGALGELYLRGEKPDGALKGVWPSKFEGVWTNTKITGFQQTPPFLV